MSDVADGFPRLRDATPRGVCPHTGEQKRSCKCRSCIGRRNRRKGQRKQSKNLAALEQITGTQAKWRGRRGNEETADHLPVRYENKAGREGGANTIWTHYQRAETQSEASRAVGDVRPFVATFSPDGTTEGLFVCRISKLPDVIAALVMNDGPEAT